MIGDGSQIFGSSPALIMSAGGVIALTVIACGLVGDGLRDVTTERWGGIRRPPPKKRRRTALLPAQETALPVAETAVLAIQGLSVRYPGADGGHPAVHDVSLHVRLGETVGIVGESGSGKTSIARAVLGILGGGRITAGRILLDGTDITGIEDAPPAQRAGLHIGYIAQQPHSSLDPTWRVGSLIAESLRRHRGLSRRAAWQAALELLEQVRLPDPLAVARKHPHQLSGGMAQRVAVARALACEPRLLVADEPTTALDVTVQADILDLLRDIQDATGMALLLITHDWGVVSDICDRAVVLLDGMVVEQAPVTVLYADPQHEYTRTLLASNPALMLAERGRRQ